MFLHAVVNNSGYAYITNMNLLKRFYESLLKSANVYFFTKVL